VVWYNVTTNQQQRRHTLKDEKARNMFTGLGAVMFILIGIILLPLVIPLVTALTSIGLTVLLAAFVIYLIIIMFTAIGSMINSARDGNTKEFTSARTAQGKAAFNSSKDWLGKQLWGLASKVAPKPENPTPRPDGYIWCPACQGDKKIGDSICFECNGSGFIKKGEEKPEHVFTGGTMACPDCDQGVNGKGVCTTCNGNGTVPVPDPKGESVDNLKFKIKP
jgi:hypothetical protein